MSHNYKELERTLKKIISSDRTPIMKQLVAVQGEWEFDREHNLTSIEEKNEVSYIKYQSLGKFGYCQVDITASM